MLLRLLGGLLRGVGVFAFAGSVLASVVACLEPATGLAGEGDRMRAESPEEIHWRLRFVGIAWGVVAVSWVLARVGTALADPNSQPPVTAARLTAEVFWLAGGLGMAVAALTFVCPRAEGHVLAEEYRGPRLLALVGGAGLLALGTAVRVLLVRASERPPATP